MTKYKTILIIVAAVVILAITAWGILKFTSLGSKIDDTIAEKKLGAALDAEIAAEQITLTPAQAENYAGKLHEAMKGWGTDEDAIYEVFTNLSTKGDLLYVIKTFGVRGGMTLVQWITAELNSKERTKLNSIIASNNIDYKF